MTDHHGHNWCQYDYDEVACSRCGAAADTVAATLDCWGDLYTLCYSDDTVVYEGDDTPFWDIWNSVFGVPMAQWHDGVTGVTDLAEARHLLGIPDSVDLVEVDHVSNPYTRAWAWRA